MTLFFKDGWLLSRGEDGKVEKIYKYDLIILTSLLSN